MWIGKRLAKHLLRKGRAQQVGIYTDSTFGGIYGVLRCGGHEYHYPLSTRQGVAV